VNKKYVKCEIKERYYTGWKVERATTFENAFFVLSEPHSRKYENRSGAIAAFCYSALRNQGPAELWTIF